MKFKSILSYFALIAMALSVVQCEEATTSTDDENNANTEEAELILTPSAFEMALTEDCYITFTATIGDEDVSNDSSLELWYIEPSGNILSVKDNSYTVSKEGEYNFYAYCSYGSKILESEVVTVNVVEDTNIYIYPSAQMVETGTDVTFSIYQGYNNITDDSNVNLYIYDGTDSTLLDEMSYTITELKDYTFYATYTFAGETNSSEHKTVSGMEWNDSVFARRTLVIQCTGTGCGWCPGATATIRNYVNTYGDDDAIFIGAHGYNTSDIMNNKASLQLISNLNITGFPTILVGSIAIGKATDVDFLDIYNGAYITNESGLASVIESLTKSEASTGIKASSSIESDGVAINAEIMVRDEGKYGVGAMVLEDGIYATQSIFDSLSFIDFEDYDINYHNNVLQGIYPLDSYLYANIGGIATQSARSGYTFDCTIPYSEMSTLNETNNCSIVVYTINLYTYQIDNIVKVAIGEELDYQYEN